MGQKNEFERFDEKAVSFGVWWTKPSSDVRVNEVSAELLAVPEALLALLVLKVTV